MEDWRSWSCFSVAKITVLLCSIAVCCAGAESTAAESGREDILKLLTAEQQALRETHAAAQNVAKTAETKASASGNNLEAAGARGQANKVNAEIKARLSQWIKDWVGVCCGVSVKDGLYTVGISFPRADASNTNSFVSFHAQTRDAKLVPVLQGLKKGDIVRFSGQAEPKTINCYFNLSFVCDVFLLKEISVANQAQTGAGPESAPAAEAAANASKERKAKALLNLAQQYLKAGKPEEARTYAQKVVAEFPETPEAQEATTILQVKP